MVIYPESCGVTGDLYSEVFGCQLGGRGGGGGGGGGGDGGGGGILMDKVCDIAAVNAKCIAIIIIVFNYIDRTLTGFNRI